MKSYKKLMYGGIACLLVAMVLPATSFADGAPAAAAAVEAAEAPEAPETPEAAEPPAGVAAGEEESPSKDPSTTLTFPGFTVDRESREVRMDATACLDSGILEYLVCLPETFEHEAIFVTDAKPELLHAALLLIGMKPSPQPPGLEELWWGRALKRADSRVRIEVEWEVAEEVHRVNIADMLTNREFGDDSMFGGEPPDDEEIEEVQDAWVFTGSFMHTNKKTGERFYAANAGGVLVGIWPNPTTVIQYGKRSGNPYRGDRQGMEVNEETVPGKGTKVKLVFSQYPQQ